MPFMLLITLPPSSHSGALIPISALSQPDAYWIVEIEAQMPKEISKWPPPKHF
jgi:hypothetical protein